MNDRRAGRLAYFASLATSDLIVCGTVERDSFSEEDQALIRDELFRRQIDPNKLAMPGQGEHTSLGPTPESYTGPIPGAWAWWSASWDLYKRHGKFIATLSLVLALPFHLMLSTLKNTHDWNFSPGLLAHLFVILAFDTLLATATIRGICRRMTQGHCSVGRAIAMGVDMWKGVFFVTLKTAAIAVGLGMALIVLGATSDDEVPIVFGCIALFFPGVYLMLRYIWAQSIAVLHPEIEDPLKQSKAYMQDRYRHIFIFFIVGFGLMWATFLGIALLSSLVPSGILEDLIGSYIFTGFWIFTKVAILVGYLHLMSNGNVVTQDREAPAEEPSSDQPPPPPEAG